MENNLIEKTTEVATNVAEKMKTVTTGQLIGLGAGCFAGGAATGIGCFVGIKALAKRIKRHKKQKDEKKDKETKEEPTEKEEKKE